MDVPERTGPSRIRLRRFILAIAACWTIAIGATMTWELRDEWHQSLDLARSEARGALKQAAMLLRWNAKHGGFFVPVTEKTKPDPLLAGLRERDVPTPSGGKLTLLSPAAMMQNIHDLIRQDPQPPIRITSLKPLDPRNTPDSWEKESLQSFENGRTEVSLLESSEGKHSMRLMLPLPIEPSCLKCHAEYGYKLGDIRGGISVRMPVVTPWSPLHPEVLHRIVGYGGMWLLGIAGIVLLSTQLRRQIDRRYQAEVELQRAFDLLEQRVVERTAELAETNRKLEAEIADRRKTEQWLLESEQRFRGYFEQGLVGMAILSPDKKWIEFNQRLCHILGYSEKELTTANWDALTHKDDLAAEATLFQRMMEGIVSGYRMEKRFVRKNGNVVKTSISVQCMRKEDRTVDCLLALVHEEPERGQGR